MRLKVTSWADLGDNTIQLRAKHNDENPVELGKHYDTIEVIDNSAITTVFNDCRLIDRGVDFMDGDFMITPYAFTYGSVTLP